MRIDKRLTKSLSVFSRVLKRGAASSSPFAIGKNALDLVLRRDWREFLFRARVRLGQIDLSSASLDELNLDEKRGYHYVDSGGLHLERILRDLKIRSGDRILDFGSGKGGALFTFSKYPFEKITGLEISPQLVKVAQTNLSRMGKKNISFIVGDAATFKDIDEYNYFYFFNPFPCHVVSLVMDNMAESIQKRPRRVVIIYCNPECHESILTNRTFKKIGEYHYRNLRYFIYGSAGEFVQ